MTPPTPRRAWRWVAAGALVLAMLAGGGSWWLSRQLDRERLVAMLSAEALRLTGRQLHVDGGLSFRVLPMPSITLQGVRLANPAGLSRPDMLRARSVVFEIALMPLLERRVELRRIALSGVDVMLETDARGRGNWVFLPPPDVSAEPAKGQPSPRAEPSTNAPGAATLTITLGHIEIDDSRLAWQAGAGSADVLEVQALRIETAAVDSAVDARLRLNGQALKVTGTVGTLAALGSGTDLPVDLAVSTDGAEITVKGTLGDTTRLSLRGKLGDPAGMARAIGREWAWPAALRLPASVSAEVEHRASLTTLKAVKLAGAGWSLAGQGNVDRSGRRPRLSGSLNAGALDLSAPAPAPATPRARAPASASAPAPSIAAGPAQTPSRIFSNEAWPLPDPPAADGRLRFDIARLRLTPKLELQALSGTVVLRPDGFGLDALAFDAAGGKVSGTVTLQQPRGATPILSIDTRAQGVTLETLAALAGFDSLAGGRSEVRVKVSGHALSAAAFARSLNGLVVLDAGPAQLRQTQGRSVLSQIVDVINPLTGAGGTTEIKCIAARLPFAGGVASVDRSVAVQSGTFDLAASGRLDLGAETLDITVMPSLRRIGSAVGPGLAPPVRLTGPITAPRLAVDAKGTANAALAIGAAVASGGISALGQRMLGAPADPQPCATALGSKPPPAAQPGGLPWKAR